MSTTPRIDWLAGGLWHEALEQEGSLRMTSMFPSICCPSAEEGPPFLVIRYFVEHLVAHVAGGAMLGFLVDALADFRGKVRVGDHAILAQNAHPLNALLLADVLDDLVDDVRLIQQHRVPRAAGDHL